MTATPIAPVEEREEDDDILEWVAPEGELPTGFTWDGEEEGDTTTTVDTDVPQPVDTDTTTTTDTTETTVVEPSTLEEGDVRNPFTGEVSPILSWISNAASEIPRIGVQNILADYTGLAAEGGKGDLYWNQFLDPNNWRNIGGGINAEGGNILSSTEHDNMWVRLPNGDSYSLKTGMLYPRHLMPENDKDLLKDESILTQIGRKFERQERLPLSEVTALANDPNNTLTGHPALTRVEAIKAKLTEVNLTLPDDQKLGPTGDYGVPEDRKLNWLFGGLANTEQGTIQQRELEHGEGIVGGFVGYMIPILATAFAISKGGKVTGIPTSIPALNRAATVPLKTAPVKTSIARVVKGIIDLAPESYLVTRAVESDRQNLVNLINPDNALAIQTDDDNQTRRSKNALVDFLIVGPPFGIGAEFLGPATKGLRRSTFKNIKQIPQQILSLPKKGNDLINRLADSIIDNLNLERADQQLELALELQQKGPSVDVKAETVSEEVIPTTRVTGSSKPVPEKPAPENVIQPKATQAELDTQVKEAEARQIKASDKAKTSTEDLINQSAKIEPKDVRPKKKLSEQFQEDLDALKGGIDQALDTAHRQVQKHQRRISLEGIETNLIDRTNANEFPAKAKRSEIEDHLTDLDTEFVRRSNELSKRNRANDNKYGGREWPTEVREKWNADFQDRQALSDRRDILKQSIKDFDAARDTNFAAPEDVIKLGGLEKEIADEARFREWVKDPGDPELKQLFDEIEELNAKTEKDIKASNELIDRIDNELDKLDEIIYGDADITDVKREEFENIYQNLDAKRQEVKSDIDEIEAKEVKGIDAVVNEEQFKKFFQDLPVEKQRALLDELRTEGAIVSMPGKIGDTPPPVDAIKSKTKFKKGGLAEAMQSVIDDLKASDERTKELFDQTLQVAKDALDLADGKIPRKEGPIVDIEATVIDDEAVLPTKFYHGAADKFTLDDSGHYNRLSSYGYGLYTTDSPKVAGGYKKKNRGDVKGKAQPTVYEIQEIRPVKFFDMEGEWTDELTNIFGKWTDEDAGPYSQLLEEVLFYLKQGHGDKYFVGDTDKLNVRGVIEMLWEINQREDIVQPHYEVGEMISDIQEYLMTKGYGGWTHVGGMGPATKGPKKNLHQVKIYWHPNEQVKIVPTDEAVSPGILPAVKDTPASKKVRQASAKARDLTKKLKGQESLNEAFTLTEKPEVPADLKATIGRYRSIRYRHDRVSFESDLDSAIYTISGHNRSKAHDRLVQWVVNELGIPPQVINDVSMNIRRKIKQNKAKSPNSIVTIKDSRAWEQSGHLDLMMEEPKDLGDIIAKQDAEIYEKYQKGEITKEQYEKATSPQDPGDQLDPKNLQFAELPDLGKYGDALGDGDPQRVMDLLLGALTERQQIQLSDELDRILGKDIADLFVTRDFRPVAGEKQAAAYGGKFKAGSRRDVRGAWDAKKQLVILSMMHKGDFVSYGSAFRTLWHEAFHGIQDLYLTVAEKTLLAASRKKLVEVAGRGFPTVRLGFFEGLSDKELQAYAFAAWHKVRSEYKADSWARPFEKLTRTLARVANAVKGMGFQTWEDIFEVSAKGEMANRAPRNIGDEGIQFEIDPDDLVEGMGKYREGIEDGSIDVEKAMESETRRLISRSGKTDYIARESTDLIAMNASMEQALREAFGDRAEVTGMPAYKIGQLFDKAAKQVQADGYDVNTTILNYEQARKGDFQSMDDLYAAAGILHHREANLEILAKAAVEYESAGDDALAGAAGKRMIGAMEDQLKLDIAWQGVTRKSAQTLRIAQTSHETALASSLPTGTEFKQTVAPEVADKAIKEGFTPTDGLLGEGVYFSTSSVAGPSGSVELYGRSLNDVPILDLASSQQRVTDLLRELNLGKAKKGKDGFQLTPSQEAGIRDYVVGEGYGGVRYGTDFLSKIPGEDQIVIYDVNTANRMIDSDAAIPPAKEEGGESVRTLLENSIKQTENILEKRLPPDVRESIAKGELTAEAREILDGMRVIAYHLKNTPGAKKAFADSIEGIPHGQLKGNAIANLIRNMLFFSMRTWMKVFFGTGYRAATLPLTQMIGTSRSQIREFVKGNPDGLKLANRRQTLNMMLYPKYLQNLPYAVRMMVSALKHNESFVNIGKTQSEITARKGFAPSDQLELDLMSKRMREEPTGNEWWLQTDANPIALAIRASWDGFSTVSGRIMGGLDSFWAGMVGPSTEWARLMEMNLFKADVKGFEPGSEKAWNWAAEQTETMLQKHFQDIDLANGEVIKDGRLVGNHAKKAMDWVTFTDDIWVPTNEPRTYEYGVRKAQEEGITDAREVIEYANAWVKEDPEDSEFRQFLEKVVNAPGVGGKMLYGKNIWQNTAAAMIRPTNRTPVNLVKGAMRMLPGTNQMVDTFRRDINSEDFFTRDRALGEIGMGFTTLSFGVMLANSGLVQFSGPASANPQERFEADRAGWQPWSIRFRLPNGDWSDWYDITMFDTAANIFGTIGAYTENVSNMSEEMADNFQGFLTVALGGTAREMTLGQFTKTALGSLNNITDLIVELQSDDVRFVSGSRNQMEKFLTDRLAMFWPAFSNVARNAVDPVRRRIDASKLPFPLNMVENAVKTIALRTPGLSSTQPAYLHPIRGTELPSNTIPGNRMIPKDEPWMKMFHDLIVPWGVTKAKEGSNDPVDLEMLRLQGRGGTFQIWNRRMFNLNDRVLDSHELNRLVIIGTQEVKINGQTLYEALLSKIQSLEYDSLPTNDHNSSQMSRRVIALNAIIKPYKEEAKLRFIEETDVEGGIGYEIKKQQADNLQRNYDAEYGIDVSVSRLDALRQLAS